ncbi:YTH domain-containing protein 1-like [Micropterus salmoides]|uniref:YTH domain-containing protein 1-like n=1 Tax=Micropterus salmoides TaxID=27706 RepID=UPI0018ED8B1C|nr:YTH domain-containing protein 1-like [Micropterus salmoides]
MKNREEETGGDNSGDGEQMEGGNQTVSCREKDTSNCQSISDEGNKAGESQQSCETVGADIENNEEEENGEDEDEEEEEEEEDETQNSKTAGPEEILAGSADIDMVGEESSLTITRQKRKSEIDSKGSKAKKVTVSKDKQKQSVKESMAEYDSSVEGRLDVSLNKITPGELNEQIYGVEKIKLFLQKTKNVKGVKVESFFPDKEAFLNSVKSQLRAKGREGLTEQEVYRLRKIVVKIRHELNEEDGEESN